MWKTEFNKILKTEFTKFKQANPRLSLRAFARKVGVSHSTLSELLRGKQKWEISEVLVQKIIDNINLKPKDRERFLALMNKPVTHIRKQFPAEVHALLTDWTFLPILFSFDLDEPLRTVEGIAHRLGLPKKKVETVAEELAQQGLLLKNKSGVYERTEEKWTSTDGLPSEVIRKHHEENLKLSIRALHEIPAPQRDFTSLTFVGDKKQFELLKQEIRTFYAKAEALMGTSKAGDELYRLSVNFFPVNFSGDAT